MLYKRLGDGRRLVLLVANALESGWSPSPPGPLLAGRPKRCRRIGEVEVVNRVGVRPFVTEARQQRRDLRWSAGGRVRDGDVLVRKEADAGTCPELALDELRLASMEGNRIHVVVRVIGTPEAGVLNCALAEPSIDGSPNGSLFKGTDQLVEVIWGKSMRVAMGDRTALGPGAVLHVTGRIGPGRRVQASLIALLTGFVSVE